MTFLKQWWPEFLITLIAGFFFVRALGTFPAAWTDDSVFMIVAKNIAAGHGYQLTILGNSWFYPYILAVGPTLLFPVAWSIQLFGFSVAVARIPMVGYLIGSSVLLYLLAWKLFGRTNARWSAVLLVTLSAFVNTGKVVMGEVPGTFFLLLGLLIMVHMQQSWKRDVLVGFCFGLSVLTKLTIGLIYPALGIVGLLALWKGQKKEFVSLLRVGIVALLVYLPWRVLEMSYATGLLHDFAFMFSSDDGSGFHILKGHEEILWRPQYLYYQTLLYYGAVGYWHKRKNAHWSALALSMTLITLFTLYFLSSFGWYRHLLYAHVLLIPFAIIGIQDSHRKKLALSILLFFVAGQTWWQITYRGSNRSTAGAEAAAYIEEHYANMPLIVQQAEVYVRLPENPQWLFLTNPIMTTRLPKEFVTLSDTEKCMLLFRGVSLEEEEELGSRFVERIAGKYGVIAPAKNCSTY